MHIFDYIELPPEVENHILGNVPYASYINLSKSRKRYPRRWCGTEDSLRAEDDRCLQVKIKHKGDCVVCTKPIPDLLGYFQDKVNRVTLGLRTEVLYNQDVSGRIAEVAQLNTEMQPYLHNAEVRRNNWVLCIRTHITLSRQQQGGDDDAAAKKDAAISLTSIKGCPLISDMNCYLDKCAALKELKDWLVQPDQLNDAAVVKAMKCGNVVMMIEAKNNDQLSIGTFFNVVIPNGVWGTIESHAFKDCTNLAFVTIPNSVTNIRGNAFSGCSRLTESTLPLLTSSLTVWRAILHGTSVISSRTCGYRAHIKIATLCDSSGALFVVGDVLWDFNHSAIAACS